MSEIVTLIKEHGLLEKAFPKPLVSELVWEPWLSLYWEAASYFSKRSS
jgi:hypothetical protein